MNRHTWWAMGVFLVGCPTTEDWQPVSYVDEGALCIEAGATDLTVNVDPGECLSSSCSRAFTGACTVTLDGNTITVTSDIAWEQNVAEGAECTDDCGSTAASCTLATPADGTYTVMFGAEETELVVPVTGTCP